MNKLVVSLSPHVHGGDSVQKNMYWVCIALVPALLCSFISFGVGAIITTAISVASCVFFEWAINKFMLKNPKCTVCDGSAILTGILLAFNMPSNIQPWIIIVGALFAIGVVKMTFGGLGCNLFNPALAGRAFLLISFPVDMTTWPTPGQGFGTYLDAETGATPLAIMKAAFKSGNPEMLNWMLSPNDPRDLEIAFQNTVDGKAMKSLKGTGCYCVHYKEYWADGEEHYEEILLSCQKLENGPVSYENPWK